MRKNHGIIQRWQIDPIFAMAFLSLIGMGLVMVSSASISIAERNYANPFYFTFRQGAYLILGLAALGVTRLTPLKIWQQNSTKFLIFAIIMLMLVLIPGIGKTVNGSSRWLRIFGFSLQISEFTKLVMIIYFADYIARFKEKLPIEPMSFIRPLVLMGFVSILLILEPDFGTTVVMMLCALGMFFLAQVPISHYMLLLTIVVGAFGALAISAPYRLQRLTAFLDPWADQYDSGYQLTQALIAFGRGEWFGVGLGASIQKLFYLPEAHTDFVFAVLSEELGLIGAIFTIVMYGILIWRIMKIALRAKSTKYYFAEFLAYGICFWIVIQALVSIGVNTGLLPTKGLTLPFISYGGNSLLALCAAIGLIWRIDYENEARSLF